MRPIFTHQKILILISGSIAAYKILDCISQLRKYGAHIKVVMSSEACKFVQPLSFEALSGNVVLCEHNQSWSNDVNHIGYAKWADVVLIAPASANTIAKIAIGAADNVLLATLLASQAKKIIAPAMNTTMLYAPQTQENLHKLAGLGYEIIPPRAGLLACGDEGEGALANVQEIIFRLGRILHAKTRSLWHNRAVIVTGGGSKESIDCVRYISNYSSGKQASYLAIALYMLGAQVKLIASSALELPLGVEYVQVQSVQDYARAINEALNARLDSINAKNVDSKTSKTRPKASCRLDKAHKHIVFMAAALADYAPRFYNGKLKKQQVGDVLKLQCFKTPDVLDSIPAHSAFKIGFKAESDEASAQDYARDMLAKKHCDMVCLNVIGTDNPFGSEENHIQIITQNNIQAVGGSKFDVSLAIASAFERFYDEL